MVRKGQKQQEHEKWDDTKSWTWSEKSRPEQRWDRDKNMRGRHMIKSWNSHQVNRFHKHHNKRLYAQHAMHLFLFFCILFIYITTSSPSLRTRFLMWLLGLVWTAGAVAVVCSRLDLLEKRALASLQRSPPHILSHSLSLHKTTFSTVAYQTSKMSKVLLMSFYFPSLSVFFLEFWEHWVSACPNAAYWIDQTPICFLSN